MCIVCKELLSGEIYLFIFIGEDMTLLFQAILKCNILFL